MNNRDEFLIEQYFSRRISAAEQQELQQRIASDAVLAEDFRFQQITAAAAIKSGRAQLKAVLQDAEKKRNEPSVRGGWSVWTRYSIAAAAAIALLVLAVPSIRQSVIGTNPAAVAQEIQFTPYPNEFATASAQEARTLLENASRAYQAGNFAEAASLFGRITPEQPVYTFYKGISLVGAKDFAGAIAVLQPLSENTQTEYAAPARYFLAEAYWNNNQKQEAKKSAIAYLATKEKRNEAVFRANAKTMIQNEGE